MKTLMIATLITFLATSANADMGNFERFFGCMVSKAAIATGVIDPNQVSNEEMLTLTILAKQMMEDPKTMGTMLEVYNNPTGIRASQMISDAPSTEFCITTLGGKG